MSRKGFSHLLLQQIEFVCQRQPPTHVHNHKLNPLHVPCVTYTITRAVPNKIIQNKQIGFNVHRCGLVVTSNCFPL